MGMLLGADELGLTTHWRFRFVPFGFRADTTPGTVFVDVGGSLRPGIIDHHGGGDDECAASAVLSHREAVYNHMLGPWRARYLGGRARAGTTWQPTIVTHASPDWDSLVAIWLVVRLIEDGDFPEGAAALVAYAREVDQGRFRLAPDRDAVLAPHLAYLAMQHLAAGVRPVSDEKLLERGFGLLGTTLAAIRVATDRPASRPSAFHPGNPGATDWSRQPEFTDVATFLRADRDRFEEDRRSRSSERQHVELPVRGGQRTMQVPAWVAERPMKSALNKYWVRALGIPFLVCPYGGSDGPDAAASVSDPVYPRVVISLDPNWPPPASAREVSRPTLRGLGYALEKAETAKRATLGADALRDGPPRFPGGYCDNGDPWYDGRGHGGTIVDAPACGTRLPYRDVLGTVVGTRFWEVPLEASELTLVWTGATAGLSRRAGDGMPVQIPGAISPMRDYLHDSRDHLATLPSDLRQEPGFEVSARVRTFPDETCGSMTIVTVSSGPGATIEGLLRERDEVVRSLGGAPQHYTYARIRFSPHFSCDAEALPLVRSLLEETVDQLGGASKAGEIVLFNSRAVLVHAGVAGFDANDARSDLEVLLYCAFVNETLVSFSEELRLQLGPAPSLLDRVDTEGLMTRMLAFQTRYYQLEVSRLPRAHNLQAELWQALRISEHYAEAQAELERLAAVEARLAEKRASTAARILELFLAILAVAGVLQTVIAFFTLDASVRRLPALWVTIGGVLILSGGVLAGVAAFRRRRASLRRRAEPRGGPR